MSNVLVVDIGTQSMRGIIFDEHGNLLVKEQIKYKPYLAPENGFMEHDQQMYEDAMFGILRTITANHPDFVKDVVAVSVDTFRDTTVLLDEHNKPVRNTILWSDQRTADVSKKLPLKQRFCLSWWVWIAQYVPYVARRNPVGCSNANPKCGLV